MSARTEIERKYLVDELPEWLARLPHTDIEQGYLSGGDEEVRLRRAGHAHFLTVKRGTGLAREESEIALSREQFERLWPLTSNARIQKLRYYEEHPGYTIEYDVYKGALEGLLVAEIEFDSVEESERFEGFPGMGREVTNDVRYSNRVLADRGLPADQG